MAHEIIALLAQYGLILVFLNVLVEQAGAPVPAVPTLVVAGALTSNGQLPLAGVLGVALLACLISDLAWYWAGRRFGSGVMRTICRVSLSPDSCVKQSELRFQRWRGQVLLVAKFVPGLSTVAPPLVGALGLRPMAFVVLDGLGSLLWLGVAVGLGYALAPEIDKVLDALGNAGTIALELVGSLLALYILAKWWQRHRLLVSLRMARITVDELAQAIEEEPLPVVIDVRSQAARLVDTRIIPGALLADISGIDRTVHDIPLDAELIIYCNCPNEASAAVAAKSLMQQGYRRVRPLLGGLDAWEAAGYTIHRLSSDQADALAESLPTQNAA
ncbi:DedA family protein/thiosulfate sulfurtransferase GlpE [Dyella subtropica]|uniref:DedA family protein/thiosulfate sulfurtransferase GlpE n=1 Tax=Dyella subtropica TaxID=2992127 RepID=UPI0022515E10|nr:DedA family protein/thiosulfate sulfurtransferase GlpE [Dyella subtropica]